MRTSAWRVIVYALIIVAGIITALPNVLTKAQLDALPTWFPKQQVTLGIDLRGGAYLQLEVDAKSLVEERMQDLLRDARQALREAKIGFQSVRKEGESVVIALDEGANRSAAITALKPFASGTVGLTQSAEVEIQDSGSGQIRMALTRAGINARISAAAEQSLEIIRMRVDEMGLAEPSLQRVGASRIVVTLPGVQDPQRIKDVLLSTGKMTFHMVRNMEATGSAPPGVIFREDKQGNRYALEERVLLSGERLTDARLGFDSVTQQPVVTFRFDPAGARRFAEITKANVGRPFAIVLDNKVLTAPVINGPIIGGSGQIEGNFTSQSASDLSALLRAGALPATLTVVDGRTVGADLGKDAIESGIFTGLIGFGLVFLFMSFLYGRWGLVANLALALNVILTFAVLSLLGSTLTLPGIAGIVLGIGLAVDANVLINERIREETRRGLGAVAALNAGFNRAFATIVDSNLTALIATLLLFNFGTGPVRGFAVTMGIGIAISMFTAVTVVRIVMSEIVRRRKLKTLVIEPPFKFIPDGTNIKFMRARFMGLAFSALLSIASIALFVTPGLNYGVDFKGGIQLEVVTTDKADLARLRSGFEALNLGPVTVQEFGTSSNVLVQLAQQPGGDKEATAAIDKVKAKLAEIEPGAKVGKTEVVYPKVSGELAMTGVIAVILASLAMLVYIWVRFEWPFAIGAIATLILDVTKTVGFFALTGIEFNLTAIAALLTLIGYSVNDKVVVYDRMRENMRRFKSLELRELIDRSINETLARSLYTSVTALLAMLPMAIWGGSAVESFAVPMVFGIIVAASSSVFIAAPILLFIGDWRKRRAASAPVVEEGEGREVAVVG